MAQEILKPIQITATQNAPIGTPVTTISDDPTRLTDTTSVTATMNLASWSITSKLSTPIRNTIIGDVQLRVLANSQLTSSTLYSVVRVYVDNTLVYSSPNIPLQRIVTTTVLTFPSSVLGNVQGKEIHLEFFGGMDDNNGGDYSTLYAMDMVVDTLLSTSPPDIPTDLSPNDGVLSNDLTPSFSGTVTHVDSINSILHIEVSRSEDFTVDLRTFSSPYYTSGSLIEVTASSILTSGLWYWRARAESENYLYSEYSNTRTITITNASPYVPTNLSPVPQQSISGIKAIFSATVTDVDFGDLCLSVEVSTNTSFSNPTTLTSPYVGSGNTASVQSSDMALGTYYWRCRAFDGDKYSAYTSTNSFTLTNQTPTLSNILPTTQSRIGTNSITLSAVVSDGDGDTVQATFQMSQDPAFSTGTITKGSPYRASGSTITMDYTGLDNGVWYYRVKAQDTNGISTDYSDPRVLYVEAPVTQILLPNSILENVNLTGSISDITTDDSAWLTATTVGTSTILRVGFQNPSYYLEVGANRQLLRATVRASNSNATPSMVIQLYENGILKLESASMMVTATTSEIKTLYWDSSILSNPSGENVECRIVTTSAGTGKNKTDIEFDHVKWEAYTKYNAGTVSEPVVIKNSNVNMTALSYIQVVSETIANSKNGRLDISSSSTMGVFPSIIVSGATDFSSYSDILASGIVVKSSTVDINNSSEVVVTPSLVKDSRTDLFSTALITFMPVIVKSDNIDLNSDSYMSSSCSVINRGIVSMPSSSTIEFDSIVVKGSLLNLESESSMSLVPSTVKSTNISMYTRTSMESEPITIKNLNADLVTTSLVTTISTTIKKGSTNLNSISYMSVLSSVIKRDSVHVSSSSTMELDYTVVKGSLLNLESIGSVSLVPITVKSTDMFLPASSMLESDPTVVKDSSTDLLSVSSILTHSNTVKKSNALLSLSSSLEVVPVLVKDSSILTESTSQIQLSPVTVKDGDVYISSSSTLMVEPKSIMTGKVNMSSTADLDTLTTAIKSLNASISISASIHMRAVIAREVELYLESSSTIQAESVVTKGSDANFDSVASMMVSPVVVKGSSIFLDSHSLTQFSSIGVKTSAMNLSVSAVMDMEPMSINSSNISISSYSSMSAVTSIVTDVEVNLSSRSSIVSSPTKVHMSSSDMHSKSRLSIEGKSVKSSDVIDIQAMSQIELVGHTIKQSTLDIESISAVQSESTVTKVLQSDVTAHSSVIFGAVSVRNSNSVLSARTVSLMQGASIKPSEVMISSNASIKASPRNMKNSYMSVSSKSDTVHIIGNVVKSGIVEFSNSSKVLIFLGTSFNIIGSSRMLIEGTTILHVPVTYLGSKCHLRVMTLITKTPGIDLVAVLDYETTVRATTSPPTEIRASIEVPAIIKALTENINIDVRAIQEHETRVRGVTR